MSAELEPEESRSRDLNGLSPSVTGSDTAERKRKPRTTSKPKASIAANSHSASSKRENSEAVDGSVGSTRESNESLSMDRPRRVVNTERSQVTSSRDINTKNVSLVAGDTKQPGLCLDKKQTSVTSLSSNNNSPSTSSPINDLLFCQDENSRSSPRLAPGSLDPRRISGARRQQTNDVTRQQRRLDDVSVVLDDVTRRDDIMGRSRRRGAERVDYDVASLPLKPKDDVTLRVTAADDVTGFTAARRRADGNYASLPASRLRATNTLAPYALGTQGDQPSLQRKSAVRKTLGPTDMRSGGGGEDAEDGRARRKGRKAGDKRGGAEGGEVGGAVSGGGGSEHLKRSSYIDRVISEIVETEHSYAKDLQDVVKGYMTQIATRVEERDLRISRSDFNTVFSNIVDICKFNSKFHGRLKRCQLDPVSIAQSFIDEAHGFQLYAAYCTNFPKAMDVFSTMMKNASIFTAFQRVQRELKHSLPVETYLVKPVQRILKYHLLLKGILSHHDKSWPGHDVIVRATELMVKVAQDINELKRKDEQLVRRQELQSLICGLEHINLATFGELLLEDKFVVSGAKEPRILFLFSKTLLICKQRKDAMFQIKVNLMVSNLMLNETVNREPFSFYLLPYNTSRAQYTIQARNAERKGIWCQEIKKLIVRNLVTIPDKPIAPALRQPPVIASHVSTLPLSNRDSSSGRNVTGLLRRRRDRRRSAGQVQGTRASSPAYSSGDELAPPSNAATRQSRNETSDHALRVRLPPAAPVPFHPPPIATPLLTSSSRDDVIARRLSINQRRSLSLESIRCSVTVQELSDFSNSSQGDEDLSEAEGAQVSGMGGAVSGALGTPIGGALGAPMGEAQVSAASPLSFQASLTSSQTSPVSRANSFRSAITLNRLDSTEFRKPRMARDKTNNDIGENEDDEYSIGHGESVGRERRRGTESEKSAKKTRKPSGKTTVKDVRHPSLEEIPAETKVSATPAFVEDCVTQDVTLDTNEEALISLDSSDDRFMEFAKEMLRSFASIESLDELRSFDGENDFPAVSRDVDIFGQDNSSLSLNVSEENTGTVDVDSEINNAETSENQSVERVGDNSGIVEQSTSFSIDDVITGNVDTLLDNQADIDRVRKRNSSQNKEVQGTDLKSASVGESSFKSELQNCFPDAESTPNSTRQNPDKSPNRESSNGQPSEAATSSRAIKKRKSKSSKSKSYNENRNNNNSNNIDQSACLLDLLTDLASRLNPVIQHESRVEGNKPVHRGVSLSVDDVIKSGGVQIVGGSQANQAFLKRTASLPLAKKQISPRSANNEAGFSSRVTSSEKTAAASEVQEQEQEKDYSGLLRKKATAMYSSGDRQSVRRSSSYPKPVDMYMPEAATELNAATRRHAIKPRTSFELIRALEPAFEECKTEPGRVIIGAASENRQSEGETLGSEISTVSDIRRSSEDFTASTETPANTLKNDVIGDAVDSSPSSSALMEEVSRTQSTIRRSLLDHDTQISNDTPTEANLFSSTAQSLVTFPSLENASAVSIDLASWSRFNSSATAAPLATFPSTRVELPVEEMPTGPFGVPLEELDEFDGSDISDPTKSDLRNTYVARLARAYSSRLKQQRETVLHRRRDVTGTWRSDITINYQAKMRSYGVCGRANPYRNSFKSRDRLSLHHGERRDGWNNDNSSVNDLAASMGCQSSRFSIKDTLSLFESKLVPGDAEFSSASLSQYRRQKTTEGKLVGDRKSDGRLEDFSIGPGDQLMRPYSVDFDVGLRKVNESELENSEDALLGREERRNNFVKQRVDQFSHSLEET